jgi:hypothetical protein
MQTSGGHLNFASGKPLSWQFGEDMHTYTLNQIQQHSSSGIV